MPEHVQTLLGGLSPAAFLKLHWQKEARLCRQAIAGFSDILDRAALQKLAARDDVESRLVVRERGRWSLVGGPFRATDFKALPARGWTLLVSGLNLHSPAADALLRRFAFLPYARMDDVMVSYAVEGGGVGPHFDSYDVFLLQGSGRRRWRYGRQQDLALRPSLPVKILRRFMPDHDAVLGPGDMLYLPPNYAHDGIAIDACMTYSIGFRAPDAQELAEGFLDFLRDGMSLAGRYVDPDLVPTREPARIDARMQRVLRATIDRVAWDRSMVERFIGMHLSEPKPDVFFDPPRPALAAKTFQASIQKRGVALDRRTRFLYDHQRFYMNGVATDIAGDRSLMRLADQRVLAAAASGALPASVLRRLHDWYRNGYLAPGS